MLLQRPHSHDQGIFVNFFFSTIKGHLGYDTKYKDIER